MGVFIDQPIKHTFTHLYQKLLLPIRPKNLSLPQESSLLGAPTEKHSQVRGTTSFITLNMKSLSQYMIMNNPY